MLIIFNYKIQKLTVIVLNHKISRSISRSNFFLIFVLLFLNIKSSRRIEVEERVHQFFSVFDIFLRITRNQRIQSFLFLICQSQRKMKTKIFNVFYFSCAAVIVIFKFKQPYILTDRLRFTHLPII